MEFTPEQNPSLLNKLKRFMIECIRVLRITRKPDMIEYKTIAKASGLGIIIIGLIGFILTMIKQLVFS